MRLHRSSLIFAMVTMAMAVISPVAMNFIEPIHYIISAFATEPTGFTVFVLLTLISLLIFATVMKTSADDRGHGKRETSPWAISNPATAPPT